MAKKSRSVYDSFGYEQINGNWYYGKTEYDAGSKSYEFVKYGRYIAIERVSIDMDGGSPILTIVYETLDGETKSICVEKSLLSKKRELQSILLQCDADAHDGHGAGAEGGGAEVSGGEGLTLALIVYRGIGDDLGAGSDVLAFHAEVAEIRLSEVGHGSVSFFFLERYTCGLPVARGQGGRSQKRKRGNAVEK